MVLSALVPLEDDIDLGGWAGTVVFFVRDAECLVNTTFPPLDVLRPWSTGLLDPHQSRRVLATPGVPS